MESFLKGSKAFPEVEIIVNPTKAQIEDTNVFVPSGWRALRDAIQLKREGKIKTLVAGPTVSDLPHLHDYVVADPAIDVCLVASQWVKDMFDSELAQAGRKANVQVWPAGVDHLFWSPQRLEPDAGFPNALVYVKNSGISQLPAVLELLATMEKHVEVLQCGSHIPQEYKAALEWSDFVIFLGESETQGLAMAQAWSMNRQTLVFDSKVISKYHRDMLYHTDVYSSASPYLTKETGAFWASPEILSDLIRRMEKLVPRTWVERHQTNQLAFSSLRSFFNNEDGLGRR
ncbi:hypothetical protein LJC40_00140 [Synergistaceae bacterium OttesenSCG-928-D05]|nr:hypothetical protein [Synergistaceae bacterium OttesenSCG-928-D05]